MSQAFLDRINALGDATRLRILRLLEREELGVGEIARIIQLPQSTVSRHLRQLLDSGMTVKRAVGTSSMYRMSPDMLSDDAARLWAIAREQVVETSTFNDDIARLEEVLRERQVDSQEFFGRLGGEWDALRRELFGDEFSSEALLALLEPTATIADIGCGTGNVSEMLAPWVKRVIAVDREPSMLKAAKKRLVAFENVEFRRGDLVKLPIDEGEIDAAVVFLVMHHVERPGEAVAEIMRTLRPGGVLLIVDMISHDREVYRHTMGHRHMGFAEADVKAWAAHAGARDVRFGRLRPRTEGKGPGLFAATIRRRAST